MTKYHISLNMTNLNGNCCITHFAVMNMFINETRSGPHLTKNLKNRIILTFSHSIRKVKINLNFSNVMKIGES